jgi:hypothetical protein
MRSPTRQSDIRSWPNPFGPIVVLRQGENSMNEQLRHYAGNRDGPLIFHMRDGPPNVTGPPRGTGPPLLSGSGPPTKTGPPMDWLAQKKTLERFNCYKNLDRKNKETENLYSLTKVNKRKNTMKTSNRNKLLSLALTGSFSLFGASNAFAAAGDTISNFATLSYDVGGSTQTVIESGSGPGGNSVPGVGQAVLLGITTDFIEDRFINFTVMREGGSVTAVPGGTQQAIPYLIDNTSNGTLGFLLKGVHNSGDLDPHGSGISDDLTPTTIETYVDVNGNGVLEAGEAIAANAFISSFAPGAGTATGGSSTGSEIRVFVVSDIPLVDDTTNPLVNGDVAVMSLVVQATADGTDGTNTGEIVADDNGNTSPGGGGFTNGSTTVTAGVAATSADDTTTMETVFNDTAFTDLVTGATIDGVGAADADQNAQQSSYSSYTMGTAALTVTKTSSTLYDPINLETSPKAIPGAFVRYTVTIANATGSATATLTNISDALVGSTMDPVLSNGGAGNAITPGSTGFNIRIVDGALTETFCLADGSGGDAADGCTLAAGIITVVLGTAAGTAVLNATESLTVEFNVIVP